MRRIYENLINLKPSATLTINELSQQLQNEGKTIYKFGLGQSPFPIPKIIIKELQINSHRKDYLNVSGLFRLREVIAKYHSIKNKYSYSANNVIVGPGSKELIFQTQLITKGDVLLTYPSWVSYAPQAKIIDKKIHWLHTSAKHNWHLQPETLENKCKQLGKNNKLLIINSPNNPSGTIHNDLKNLAFIAKKYNIIVLADEIYAELDFTGDYKSLTHYYPEGTIISSGLSKWCGAGGWRLGTIIFPNELEDIYKTLRSVASETFTSVSTPIQYAAIKAYTKDFGKYLINSRMILKHLAEFLHTELTNIGIICNKPQGGFYMLCDFSNIIPLSNEISDSPTLCSKILNESGVAMLPGSDFGISEKKLITRIAFVDFDGEKALNFCLNKYKLPGNFIKKVCPNILNGVNKLKDWVKKNSY